MLDVLKVRIYPNKKQEIALSKNFGGFKNDVIDLSVRDWICPNCQTHHDRDENAAKNLRAFMIKDTVNKYRWAVGISSLWRRRKTR